MRKHVFSLLAVALGRLTAIGGVGFGAWPFVHYGWQRAYIGMKRHVAFLRQRLFATCGMRRARATSQRLSNRADSAPMEYG